MPDEDVTARLRLKDQRRFARGMRSSGDEVGRFGKKTGTAARQAKLLNNASRGMGVGMRNAGRWVGYTTLAIGGGLVYETNRARKAFEEKRKIVAQTGAVLASTGGAAGVAERQIGGVADELSRMSGIDDEKIRELQNRLLTFPTIRRPIFERTAAASLDLAVAKHMEGTQAAEQLGKALAIPSKGYSRLQRSGVVFTDQQVEQIKALEKSGDLLGAQKVILREVEREFGGSAKAQATATDRLKVTVGNLEEAYGEALAPAVDESARLLDKWGQKALPRAEKSAKEIERIFGRGDLDLGEKLSLSGHAVSGNFSPLVSDLRAEFDKLDLGDKLGGAVEAAAPQMADAMAGQVPRMASAFVNAFTNAGPGGQLLTAAIIMKKLGAFAPAGQMAATTFAGPTGLTSPKSMGKMRRAGRKMGRAIGPYVALAMIPFIMEALDEIEGDISEEQDLTPKERRDRAPSRREQREIRAENIGEGFIPAGGLSREPLLPSTARDAPGLTRRPRRRGAQHGSRRETLPFPGWAVSVSVGDVLMDGESVGQVRAKAEVRRRERG